MRIVALEGPSFSGKTTLLLYLKSQLGCELTVASNRCYVAEITQSDQIPLAHTRSTNDQLSAFRLFMNIEAKRVQRLNQFDHDADILLLDRSVDTLLAHAYTLDRLLGYDAYQQARALLRCMVHLVPHETIYLDAGPETLQTRRELLEAPFDSFLIDPAFVARFREYFLTNLPISARVHIINAEVDPRTVAMEATKLLSPT